MRRKGRKGGPKAQLDPLGSLSLVQMEEMIQACINAKMDEYELTKANNRTRHMGLEEGPLSAEIYMESMVDFKCPNNLPSFRGSGDS